MVRETEGRPNVGKSFRSPDAFILAERTFICALQTPDEMGVSPRGAGNSIRLDKQISERAPLAARAPGFRGSLGLPELHAPRVVSLRMLPDIPVRHLKATAADPNAPPHHVAIPARCAAVLYEFEGTPAYGSLCRAVLSVHSKLVQRIQKAGVPLFVPREIAHVAVCASTKIPGRRRAPQELANELELSCWERRSGRQSLAVSDTLPPSSRMR